MKRINPVFLCGILFLLLFLSMLALNLCTPLIADDYVYSMRDYAGAGKMTFHNFLKMQYNALNGRVLLHTLLAGALMLPRTIFALLNASVYCALIWLAARHSGTRRDPVLTLFAIILFWFFIPVFGETVLWTTGSCNYLWGTVIVLCFLIPYTDTLSESPPAVKNNRLYAVRTGVLGLLAGATNENTAGAAILFCTLTLLITLLRFPKTQHNPKTPLYRRVPLWMATGIFGASAGYCFMITAPANFVRADNAGSVSLTARLATLSDAAFRLYLIPAIIYICLLTLTIFVLKNEGIRKSLPSLVFVVCGCAAGAVMLLPAQAPDRAFFGGIVFMITAILYQTKVLLAAFSRNSLFLVPALCLVTVAFAFSISQSAFHLRTIKHLADGRDTYIREQIEQGLGNVVTYRIASKTARSALSTLGDLPANASTWKNQSMAYYYRLETIRSEEVRNVP